MISIAIVADTRYAVNRKRLRKAVIEAIRAEHIQEDCSLTVSVVGDRKMRQLNKKYRGKDQTTDVLSFAYGQKRSSFTQPPGGKRNLGEIIISYPQVVAHAREKNRLIDDQLGEIAAHGAKHLLGYDHDALGRWSFLSQEGQS